jgi:glycosyltransferase involved in cell wall biosynthesis
VTLSVVIITYNEEANIGRTLDSVMPLVRDGKGEIIVVDSGSTDRTVEIARSFGAKVFVEEWKGFAAQKNSALEKASGDWILSLDADEEVDGAVVADIRRLVFSESEHSRTPEGVTVHRMHVLATSVLGFRICRKNFFLGKWIKHGGFWPDPKVRLFRKSAGRFEHRAVHEDVRIDKSGIRPLQGALIHHSYSTLSDYIEHMNRYSSLGAEMAVAKGYRGFSFVNIVLRPWATFVYNYFFRFGFLDGREGLLLHLYHAVYVSWKYAKAWELGKKNH